MNDQLQNDYTVEKLASAGQVFEICSKIKDFEQLAQVIEKDLAALDPKKFPSMWKESEIIGEIKFDLAGTEECFPIMIDDFTANIFAVCQRCLELMEIKVQVKPKVALMELGQSMDSFDEFEIWELSESTLKPHEVIEELLIMALPLSVMHNDKSKCKASLAYLNNEKKQDLVRPFANLRSQLKKNK